MRRVLLIIICLLVCGSVAWGSEEAAEKNIFNWWRLPDLPRAISGHYAGVSNGALIVAGGTYFPVSSSEGGTEVWTDDISLLEPGSDGWRTGLRLKKPLAYGAAVTTNEGIICIGGRDADRCYSDVFRLRWADGQVETFPLPGLPGPSAFHAAAIVENTIYVAGGQGSPDAVEAMRSFWALDLSGPQLKWEELESWPGSGRILPVAVARDGAFYLISGAELLPGEDGKVTRQYLADAYRFRPEAGWERIADMPGPVAGASAVAYGQSHILVFGGDSGKYADEVREPDDQHPGFRREITAYHTITDTWTEMGKIPENLTAMAAVQWQDAVVIPGGQVRPGHRSSRVHAGQVVITKGYFGFLDYAGLGIYLLAMLLMGVYFARREKTTGDFFLAGRRVPWWAAGLSILATQVSSIGFMAIPAKSYATDWVYFLGVATWFIVVPIVIHFYMPFFRRLNITTAYEYLEKRFSLPVRLFGSIAFIFLQLGRMSVVLYLPAIALSSVTGINIYACILIMGVLCTLYAALGGIEAVIWTDVLQSVILMGGALVSVLIIVFSIDGGIGAFFHIAHTNGKFHTLNWTWDITTTAVWVVLMGNVFSRLGTYTSDQTVVQRYLTTRDEKQAARSLWANVGASIPWAVLVFALGTALFAFYKTRPDLLNPAVKTDGIVAWFIAQQLPAGLSGLVIAALFAAAMSSLDSSINSVATALVTDFYGRFRPAASDRNRLSMARWLTVILGTIGILTALLMATYEIKSLWDFFMRIVGLLGGGLGGLFALGIFTRRANGFGSLIGAIVSAVTLLCVQSFTHIHFFLYAATGMIVCFVVGYLASLLIPASTRNLEGLTIHTINQS